MIERTEAEIIALKKKWGSPLSIHAIVWKPDFNNKSALGKNAASTKFVKCQTLT